MLHSLSLISKARKRIGSRWASRTSNPVSGSRQARGGFDSHALPPRSSRPEAREGFRQAGPARSGWQRESRTGSRRRGAPLARQRQRLVAIAVAVALAGVGRLAVAPGRGPQPGRVLPEPRQRPHPDCRDAPHPLQLRSPDLGPAPARTSPRGASTRADRQGAPGPQPGGRGRAGQYKPECADRSSPGSAPSSSAIRTTWSWRPTPADRTDDRADGLDADRQARRASMSVGWSGSSRPTVGSTITRGRLTRGVPVLGLFLLLAACAHPYVSPILPGPYRRPSTHPRTRSGRP